jgi:hypothetical protein
VPDDRARYRFERGGLCSPRGRSSILRNVVVTSDSTVEPARALAVDSVLELFLWRSVVIARWKRVPEVGDIRRMRELLRSALTKQRAAFAAINFVEARDATSFGDDVRAEVAATQREFEPQQVALATVIEGTGFFSSTVRSVAIGVALLARTRFSQRVFESGEAASEWVASKLDDLGADGARSLAVALATLRARAAA